MTAIDATGLQALETLADVVHSTGRALILCGAREQPARLMRQSEFEEHVGTGNICTSITEALERAQKIIPLIRQNLPPESGWGRRDTDLTIASSNPQSFSAQRLKH